MVAKLLLVRGILSYDVMLLRGHDCLGSKPALASQQVMSIESSLARPKVVTSHFGQGAHQAWLMLPREQDSVLCG